MTQTKHVTDHELKNAVIRELEWTPSVNSTHVGVSVNHGTVTLSGAVDGYPEKRQAEKAAQRVLGVTAIAGELTVSNRWAAIDDSDIAREAEDALDRSVDVPDGVIKAAVNNHKIELTGVVNWQFQREAASRAVRYLKGVTGIYNTISIRPKVSASGIKESLTAALVRNAGLEGGNTTVTASPEGAVILAGDVKSWSERSDIEKIAWATPGVSTVTNQLRITY